MSWENKKFIEFILLQRGHDLTKKQIKPGIFPVVTSTSIMGYHNEYKAEGPGVITGRSGTIGEVQYVEENYWPHNTSLFVKDFKGNYPRYVYYFMKHFGTARAKSGSAVPTLNRNNLNDIEISVPDVDTQVRIANILSAYDSLIENNQKQIKLLEEAAQRLYKEWFVDLRFPGHEDVAIVDGVPEGWKNVKLSEVANVNKQSISKQYPYSYVDYVDISSVSQGHIEVATRFEVKEAPGRAKRVASDGDIIWGMVRPNLKSYALVFHPTETNVFSTGFAVLSAEKIPFSFLYCYVTQEDFVRYLVNCTNGAAYPAVKPVHFEEAELILPTSDILSQFHLNVEPMYRKIESLEKQIRQLKEARDRLLPKLMNGEIEV